MNDWSLYFQNAEYLAKTRYMLMNREMLPLVIKWLQLEPGTKVLDVGCGSGEYSFYLAGEAKEAEFTGLDMDSDLIRAAQLRAEESGEGERIRFLQGDALRLPFEDGVFDVVVSQTFLINIPDHEGALWEMKRVCKKGGFIASSTAASLPIVTEEGEYPSFYMNWKKPYDRLLRKAWEMYEALSPVSSWVRGLGSTKIQRAFVNAGLGNIRTYPVGGFFSLSNPTVSEEDKKRYLEMDYLAETKKLRTWFEQVPEAKHYFTAEEVAEFEAAALAKKTALTAALGENRIWEWSAVNMLLVIGTNTGNDPVIL